MASKEWDRNNFPTGITIEYSTTGQAGGYLTDGAPESTPQPVQPLGGSYCELVPNAARPATVFHIAPLKPSLATSSRRQVRIQCSPGYSFAYSREYHIEQRMAMATIIAKRNEFVTDISFSEITSLAAL